MLGGKKNANKSKTSKMACNARGGRIVRREF